jgi:glyoxylase-like metal-dependent hydrolase (beta-lactamase superfamily II)
MGNDRQPLLRHFHDAATGTFTHLVACPLTGSAVVIDPVLDFDMRSGATSTHNVERLLAELDAEKLSLQWILETHVHADHLSAAQFLKQHRGGRVAIGAGVCAVQKTFVERFGLHERVAADGSQFDRLWRDSERFALGSLDVQVVATPGHTSDSVSYVIGKHVFAGDTVFRASFGTARCDFPGGDAGTLFDSIMRLYALPDDTVLHFCHDYPDAGVAPLAAQTVGDLKARNIHLSAATAREEFITRRRARDATLPLPALLIPAVQVNIAAGKLPARAGDRPGYLKLPLDVL